MADIFISYKREEQPLARRLADALEKKGWSVWWDPKLRAGERFDDAIEEALKDAKSVIVMWSQLSVQSRYVRDEATYALNRNKLVPIKIEQVNLPFRFEGIQTEEMINWNGSDLFPGFQKLIAGLSFLLGEPPIEVKEAEQVAEKERKRKQEEERKRKEDEQRKTEEESQRLENEKRRIAEERRRLEEERQQAEAERKAEEERKRKEEEELRKAEERREFEEEQKRAEAERKAEEGRRQKEIEARPKTAEEKRHKKAIEELQQLEKEKRRRKEEELRHKEIEARPKAAELERHKKAVEELQQLEKEKRRIKVEWRRPSLVEERNLKELEETTERAIKVESERKVEEERKHGAVQKSYKNSIGMEFVLIPAGSFVMGSRISPEELVQRYGGEKKECGFEKPHHPVKIEQPFYLQTTPVTHGQWQRLTGDNPSSFKDCGDDCPVEQASWIDVQMFIEELNRIEEIKDYRLPSEAEWEYSCRAGSETEFFFGSYAKRLGEFAWYSENSDAKTHPVGKKKPNAWGLYDMYGNVWEWVEDDWHGSYDGAPVDGRAWVYNPRGSGRVVRGGSWSYEARYCRSATRNYYWPGYRPVLDVGFRLSRSVALGL